MMETRIVFRKYRWMIFENMIKFLYLSGIYSHEKTMKTLRDLNIIFFIKIK